MNFSQAWSNLIKENLHLKICILVLTISTITLAASTTSLSLRPATIIERGCYSGVAKLGSKAQTSIEYEKFLEKALTQRFNTNSKVIEGYLSVLEKRKKIKEQSEFKKNGIVQIVLIRNLKISNNSIYADLDRVFSIKDIRSTVPIRLKLKLETKDRTRTNPYGLILVKTEEVKKKGGKDEKK